MAKSWHFPRWRFFTMQGVMCALLAGTIGLAAFVDHRLKSAQLSQLTDVIVDGPLSFRMPAGWRISRNDGSLWTERLAMETGSQPGRTITVRRQRIDRMMSPLHYLAITGQLGNKREGEPALIGDQWPGELVLTYNVDLKLADKQTLICCAVLPTREAITLRMDKPGPIDRNDERLINTLAQNIRVTGIDSPTSGAFEVPGGIKVNLPSDYRLMPERDPLRTERTLFADLPTGRVMLQLIPVVLPSDMPGPLETMKSVLTGRETDDNNHASNYAAMAWLSATVVAEAPDRWCIDPRDVSNGLSVRRAYLIGTVGGPGLLISMEAGPNDQDALDEAWKAISASVNFSQTIDLKKLLATGQASAHARLPVSGQAEPYRAWRRNGVAEGAVRESINNSRDTIRREWDGVYTEVKQRWGVEASTGNRSAIMDRSFTGVDSQGNRFWMFRCVTDVTDAVNTEIIADKQYPVVSSPLSPAFVLSSQWPTLLGYLQGAHMAFITDRFVGSEGDLLPQPIVLLVDKSDKYVQVQVNGSGQTSRWFFKPDGSLDHGEFPGGLRLEPSSLKDYQDVLSSLHLTVVR